MLTEEHFRRAIQDAWSAAQASTDPRIIREYRGVVRRLRVELLEFLTATKARPSAESGPLDPWLLDPLTPMEDAVPGTALPSLRDIQKWLKSRSSKNDNTTQALLTSHAVWRRGTPGGSIVAATDGHMLVEVSLPDVKPPKRDRTLVAMQGRAVSRKPITADLLATKAAKVAEWDFPNYDPLWEPIHTATIELRVCDLLHLVESEGPPRDYGRWRSNTFHITKDAFGLHGEHTGAFRKVKGYDGPPLVFNNRLVFDTLGFLDPRGSVTVLVNKVLSPVELRQQGPGGAAIRLMMMPMRCEPISEYPPVIPGASFKLPKPATTTDKITYGDAGSILLKDKQWRAKIGKKEVTRHSVGESGSGPFQGSQKDAEEALRRAAWLVTKGRL